LSKANAVPVYVASESRYFSMICCMIATLADVRYGQNLPGLICRLPAKQGEGNLIEL
jgi:hypothetical protein